jgi:hypothetical protein
MSIIRFTKALQRPATPALTFTTVDTVRAMGRLLLEVWGSRDHKERIQAFIYSCTIFDNYASDFAISQTGQPRNSIRQSWIDLASHGPIAAQIASLYPVLYISRTIGNITLRLPIDSLDPSRAGQQAPRTKAGNPAADFAIKDLTIAEFAESAYMVRCNLFHGSMNLEDDEQVQLIFNVDSLLTPLVVWMLQNTQW